jgi:dynein heavy chain
MKNHSWANAQKMMKDPKKFVEDVKTFDGENIDEKRLEGLKPMLAQDWFTFEVMKGKSVAAAFLCSWIVNIVVYNTIFKKVKPLKDAADEAQATADSKTEELKVVIEKVRVINEKVEGLKAQLAEAEANKKRVEDEAQALQD